MKKKNAAKKLAAAALCVLALALAFAFTGCVRSSGGGGMSRAGTAAAVLDE